MRDAQVSVVMSVFDGERFLGKSVEGIDRRSDDKAHEEAGRC